MHSANDHMIRDYERTIRGGRSDCAITRSIETSKIWVQYSLIMIERHLLKTQGWIHIDPKLKSDYKLVCNEAKSWGKSSKRDILQLSLQSLTPKRIESYWLKRRKLDSIRNWKKTLTWSIPTYNQLENSCQRAHETQLQLTSQLLRKHQV